MSLLLRGWRPIARASAGRCDLAAIAAALLVAASAGAEAAELDEMTGCWITEQPAATSLETDASKPDGVKLVYEEMLLMFERMEGTEHLVFGRIYEWNETEGVLGPQYQNGVFDPVAKTITFGFPEGGLDTVHALARDRLLYIHRKSSTLSAMSVRHMSRLDCEQARHREQELLRRKGA